MTVSVTMQSCIVSPMSRTSLIRNNPSNMLPSVSFQSKRAVTVKCQAEEKQMPEEQPAAAPKPKVSTKFWDVLAFSGPAPERINGRLAMIGFVAAMGAELASGNDLSEQLINGGGLPAFVITAAILSAASLVPLFKGVTVQSKSGGLMTADAEMWNGRFAMLGLVALAFTEYVKGGPLV